LWGAGRGGVGLNKCIFIHFRRSGWTTSWIVMGFYDADLVRRLPIESVGIIVDEVVPCKKMGPSKKYPRLKKKWGLLKKYGRQVKRRCAPVYYPHNGLDLFNGDYRENPQNCLCGHIICTTI